jgi:aminoglycoside 3-N-acetyltransferase
LRTSAQDVLTGLVAELVVSAAQVAEGVERLGISGAPVCLHASLRSFPRLAEGPVSLVNGLLDAGVTVMMATMAGNAFDIPAPPDDRPVRNGIDYAKKDALAEARPWPGQSDIYDSTRTEVDRELGATSAYLAARPDRLRCRLSTGTFSAVGPLAAELIGGEVAADTFGPLRQLVARSGWVLLAGVGLTRMTLLHLAEVEAGRRPFVRWSRGPGGQPVRSAGGGCSEGFERLTGALAAIERRTVVGESLWRACPAGDAVALAAAAIRTDPSITACDKPECRECTDAVAGGPVDT